MPGWNYTTIHLKAVIPGQPNMTVADMYRTQGSCIVEHCELSGHTGSELANGACLPGDVLQQMQVNTTNPHAYF